MPVVVLVEKEIRDLTQKLLLFITELITAVALQLLGVLHKAAQV
jgi:hypothetical protein